MQDKNLCKKLKLQQQGEDKKMHDYGLNEQDKKSAMLGWRAKPFKKVTMTNVWIAKDRLTVDKVAKQLEGCLIRPEWERRLAYWLVKAVAEAVEKGEKTADITQLFCCEMEAEDQFGKFVLQQEYIQNELMYKLFWRCSETEEELRVKLDWRVVFCKSKNKN